MPVHDYVCRACGKEFEDLVLGSEEVRCPECDGVELERRMSAFATRSARAERPAPGPCGSCGDPRGPGACSLN
jgi:putative FmdB family regulatory protein